MSNAPGTALVFNRHELAGSLGDLGTLLPIAIGLILINGLSATAILCSVGLFYALAGLYFRVTVPVQPMKVIGAYAIAGSLSPLEISSAALWMGVFLMPLGAFGATNLIIRVVPRSTIRGVQLTTGVLLLSEGVRMMLGRSLLQQARGLGEPFLAVQTIGPIPIGWVLGPGALLLILLLLENRKIPAALAVILLGGLSGLALGGLQGLDQVQLGVHLPQLLPYGLPSVNELLFVLMALALPQLPMTIGNAVIAQADLTQQYFGPGLAQRSSPRALALSMGLANCVCALIGGMPLCHGAGGLAAHYNLGARSAGSNLMIGAIVLLVGVILGDGALALLGLLPCAVLGALLLFAGAQLALTILDIKKRRDLFVVITMLGISLATNLALGFAVGLVLAHVLRSDRLRV